MLTDCRALPSSDLWSLGVIIYKMHVGEVPFLSQSETATFQKILSLDFTWPEDIEVSIEAKDLVERLLKLNPRDRLGAGEPGSPNDMN